MAIKMAGTLPDQIADYLLGKIVRLEIEPGERILEAEVAEELGVSRSPVREALRILEKTGFTREGYLRDRVIICGIYEDVYLYARLKNDPPLPTIRK